MGPCLSLLVVKDEKMLNDLNTLNDEISNKNVSTSKKGNEWNIIFENTKYTVTVKDVSLEEILDILITKKSNLDFNFEDEFKEINICCYAKDKELNNKFMNNFLMLFSRYSYDVLEILGGDEFNI